MTNQERIKEYLVGNKDKVGYLKSGISNGKVIMLSGVWGSGKTHFWQNEIASEDLIEDLKKEEQVYSYISLYGKSSIEEIENDIFSQSYYSAIGGENFVTKGFSTFTKRMKRFGSSKIANGLDEEQKDNIERIALERLNNGGIICFDDFERKSKDIDLNDLFGFITQLTLNFNCKVVIIVNEDVFEGKEKEIFSNVKEKTVSKFLNYKPKIEELFDLIFINKKYKSLEEYKNVVLSAIKETKELNARIYIQIFDNLLEWIENKNTENNDEIVRCLILANINFILFHKIINAERFNNHLTEKESDFMFDPEVKGDQLTSLFRKIQDYKYENKSLIDELIYDIYSSNSNVSKMEEDKKIIIKNKNSILSVHFLSSLKFNKNVSKEQLTMINNFIETGILIEEKN